MDDGEVLHPAGPGGLSLPAHVVHHAALDAYWDRLLETHGWRRDQLDRGLVEVTSPNTKMKSEITSIRVISAGAGSGKTFRLAEELRRAVSASGDLAARPEAVIATTFTRKAAAELAGRARQHLVAAGLWDQAFRLDAALIGTVHSVCDTLLRRFSLHLGLAPEMDVLDEGDFDIAFGEALSGVADEASLARLVELARRFGVGGRREGNTWRGQVREIVDAALENGIASGELAASARRSIEELLALFPPLAAESAPEVDQDLAGALAAARAAIPADGDDTRVTDRYRALLEQADAAFRNETPLPWPVWVKLSKEGPGKKSAAAAEAVQRAAARHLQHPRLRTELAEWIELHFRIAALAMAAYSTWKRERRLLDFVDQQALALQLLDLGEVQSQLVRDVDLVLVDEFQDTSPLELAMFLKLARLAGRSVWVGDGKQSIFTFRGADARQMRAVLERIGAGASPELLSFSRRSRPSLVTLVSELFARAMEGQVPREQVVLTPVRSEHVELPPPLHHWLIRDKNRSGQCAGIAAGIARLLGQGRTGPMTIIDPETGTPRPAVPGDVAVLCRSNDHAAGVASALEDRGVRAALARAGLLATPEATLALACLRRLHDPADSLATAEIVALTAGDPDPAAWLPERLAFVAAGGRPEGWQTDHPVVAAVETLRSELNRASPSELLDDVIARVGLTGVVQAWGNGRVRVGNLDSLRGLARSHVVVLDDLHEPHSHGPWGLSVAGDGRDLDVDAPLSGRWLRFWPWPYGAQAKNTGLAERSQRSPIVIDAVQREMEEDLRLLYVGMTRARDVLVLPALETSAGGLGWIERIFSHEGKTIFRLPRAAGDQEVPIVGTREKIAVRVEVIEPGPVNLPCSPQRWVNGARAVCTAPAARVAASQVSSWPVVTPIPTRFLGLGQPMVVTGTDDVGAVGNAVHAFLGADDPALGDAARIDMVREILQRFGVPAALDVHALVARADQLREELARHTRWTGWHTECPVEVRVGDQVVVGRIDLLLDTPAGFIVVDHKSHLGDRESRLRSAAGHFPQLALYTLGVRRATGRPVTRAFLSFVLAGELFEYTVPEDVRDLEILCRASVTNSASISRRPEKHVPQLTSAGSGAETPTPQATATAKEPAAQWNTIDDIEIGRWRSRL